MYENCEISTKPSFYMVTISKSEITVWGDLGLAPCWYDIKSSKMSALDTENLWYPSKKYSFRRKHRAYPSLRQLKLIHEYLNNLLKKWTPMFPSKGVFLRWVPSTFCIHCTLFSWFEIILSRCSSPVSLWCYFTSFECITARAQSPLHLDRRFYGNFTVFVHIIIFFENTELKKCIDTFDIFFEKFSCFF